MSELFRVSAKAVIIDDDRVLLIRKPSGVWDLPGGQMELGESPESALSREAYEELNIPVCVNRLLHVGVRRKSDGPDVVAVIYLCRLECRSTEIALSHEHEAVGAFKCSELPALSLDGVYRRAIEAAFADVPTGSAAGARSTAPHRT